MKYILFLLVIIPVCVSGDYTLPLIRLSDDELNDLRKNLNETVWFKIGYAAYRQQNNIRRALIVAQMPQKNSGLCRMITLDVDSNNRMTQLSNSNKINHFFMKSNEECPLSPDKYVHTYWLQMPDFLIEDILANKSKILKGLENRLGRKINLGVTLKSIDFSAASSEKRTVISLTYKSDTDDRSVEVYVDYLDGKLVVLLGSEGVVI